MERFLAEPENYIKGPWISVAMPFKQAVKPGEPFEQPFSQVPLRFAPYQHQLMAFERLSGKNPRSTLVATGTGSGKTEVLSLADPRTLPHKKGRARDQGYPDLSDERARHRSSPSDR